MLNPVTFEYEAESGPVTVTTTGLDYAEYERVFDRTFMADLAAGRYITQCFVIWNALKRDGHMTLTLDEFMATSPQFEAPEKVEEIVPLESPAPIGS